MTVGGAEHALGMTHHFISTDFHVTLMNEVLLSNNNNGVLSLLRHRFFRGFTIVELITVIVLLAILSAVAVSAWPGERINLSAQAKALASDIRHAQNLSMTRGVRYEFLRTSSSSYQISTVSGTNVTTRNLGSTITFGTLANLPNNLVAFDGRGVPYVNASSPGTALATTATIAITADGATKTISITPNTGYVSISG